MTFLASADRTLVRLVHEEELNSHRISASLTRFGGLAVFATDGEGWNWQGDNIIDARRAVLDHAGVELV